MPPDLTPKQQILFDCFASLSDDKNETTTTLAKVSEWIGWSEGTVGRVYSELKQLNLIHNLGRGHNKGRNGNRTIRYIGEIAPEELSKRRAKYAEIVIVHKKPSHYLDWEELLIPGYPDVEAMLRDLYVDKKISLHDIGEMLGTDKQPVRRMLCKYNIPIRKKGRPPFKENEKTVKEVSFDKNDPLSCLEGAEINILRKLIIIKWDESGPTPVVSNISVRLLKIDNLYRYPGLMALLKHGLLKDTERDELKEFETVRLKLKLSAKLISALSNYSQVETKYAEACEERMLREKECRRLGIWRPDYNDRSTERKNCNNYDSKCLTICAIFNGNYLPCPSCDGSLPWPEKWVRKTIDAFEQYHHSEETQPEPVYVLPEKHRDDTRYAPYQYLEYYKNSYE